MLLSTSKWKSRWPKRVLPILQVAPQLRQNIATGVLWQLHLVYVVASESWSALQEHRVGISKHMKVPIRVIIPVLSLSIILHSLRIKKRVAFMTWRLRTLKRSYQLQKKKTGDDRYLSLDTGTTNPKTRDRRNCTTLPAATISRLSRKSSSTISSRWKSSPSRYLAVGAREEDSNGFFSGCSNPCRDLFQTPWRWEKHYRRKTRSELCVQTGLRIVCCLDFRPIALVGPTRRTTTPTQSTFPYYYHFLPKLLINCDVTINKSNLCFLGTRTNYPGCRYSILVVFVAGLIVRLVGVGT